MHSDLFVSCCTASSLHNHHSRLPQAARSLPVACIRVPPTAVMQRMQRKFGRLPFMARSPNEADIEAMLRDFNDSDQMLKNVSTHMHCCASTTLAGAHKLS